jgi:pimeloyl-ACP methyl ester carboxylesterase
MKGTTGRTTLAGLAALFALALSGCTELDKIEIGGATNGEACNQISDCDAGLLCEDGICVPVDDITSGPQRGDICTSNADCAPDLFCGTQGVCARTAGAPEGSACGLTIDCEQDLVCHGASLTCVDPADYPRGNGIKDEGQSCTTLTDCRRPFLCAIADTTGAKCEKIPFFPGPDCVRSDQEAGAFRVYYEIPPDAPAEGEPFEFYRLPFPNDIRVVNGHIDLTGHPAPGEVMGINVAGEYIRSVEQDADGFALNGPVFFRLTDFPQRSSICLDPGSRYPEVPAEEAPDPFCPQGGDPSVYLVDLATGQHLPVQIDLFRDRGQYRCQNAIGVAPLDGVPLSPRTTYAVVLTTDLRDIRGDAPIQDQDFARILEADSSLPSRVIGATAPLRNWIDATPAVSADSLAAAAVFTTGNPSSIGEKLFDAVMDLQPDPVFNDDAFSCDNPPPLPPPCHGRLLAGGAIPERECGSNPAVIEIHGTYDAPVFQQGTRPYLTAQFGGELNLDDAGSPDKVRDETMCYALTVPRGVAMPPGGWPVVIYAHGTNGTYRSFVEKSILEDFTTEGFAVIGFDNVMHGPRQDPSANPDQWVADLWELDEPGNLYFNVINSRAARDNTLQGAADLFWLTRLLGNDSPVVSGVDTLLDPDQIYFFGHSQGTTIASPYLVHESGIRAAILSGAGAELVLSILNKTEPVNIAELVGTLFGDQNISRIHPMMGLLAILFGPADSVAYADGFVLYPTRSARPLLMFSGIGDHFSPDATQAALIRAMGIPLVTPVEQPLEGVDEVNPPITNVNIFGTNAGVPAGALQFTPQTGTGSDDGHFVLFNTQDARDALRYFLSTTLAGSPEIDR